MGTVPAGQTPKQLPTQMPTQMPHGTHALSYCGPPARIAPDKPSPPPPVAAMPRSFTFKGNRNGQPKPARNALDSGETWQKYTRSKCDAVRDASAMPTPCSCSSSALGTFSCTTSCGDRAHTHTRTQLAAFAINFNQPKQARPTTGKAAPRFGSNLASCAAECLCALIYAVDRHRQPCLVTCKRKQTPIDHKCECVESKCETILLKSPDFQ
jgi:hypothetical protein